MLGRSGMYPCIAYDLYRSGGAMICVKVGLTDPNPILSLWTITITLTNR